MKSNAQASVDEAERCLRLAFRAQAQSRATIETLGLLKNPTVFARQANIAHGPQEINNGPVIARAREKRGGSGRIKLLEAHGERLDPETTAETGAGHPPLAALGTRHRSANGRREGAVIAERVPR